MPTIRCKYNNVHDNITRKTRMCKKTIFTLNYCYHHIKMLHNDIIIKIQSVYRGHYIRRKLNIVYKLPRDIQRKIIWHMNYDIYMRNYNNSIIKILYNKYKKFYNNEYNQKILNNLSYGYNITELFKQELSSIINLTLRCYLLIDKFKIIAIINKIRIFINYYYFNNPMIITGSNIEQYDRYVKYYHLMYKPKYLSFNV